jgi:hypothetical protein
VLVDREADLGLERPITLGRRLLQGGVNLGVDTKEDRFLLCGCLRDVVILAYGPDDCKW